MCWEISFQTQIFNEKSSQNTDTRGLVNFFQINLIRFQRYFYMKEIFVHSKETKKNLQTFFYKLTFLFRIP